MRNMAPRQDTRDSEKLPDALPIVLAYINGEVWRATDTGWLRTQREAIVAYARARHLEKPVIVGHSLGGFLALWIAAEHPELPGAVVNVDGMPFFGVLMNPNATRETMRPMAGQMRAMMLSPGARENYMRMQDVQVRMMARDTASHACAFPSSTCTPGPPTPPWVSRATASSASPPTSTRRSPRPGCVSTTPRIISEPAWLHREMRDFLTARR